MKSRSFNDLYMSVVWSSQSGSSMSAAKNTTMNDNGYEYFFDQNYNCVLILFYGDVDAERFIEVIQDFEQQPDHHPSLNRLYDFRQAKILFSSNEIIALSGWAQLRNYADQNRRVVHLSTDDVSFGLLRVLTAHSEAFSDNLIVTRKVDEALLWMGLPKTFSLKAP